MTRKQWRKYKKVIEWFYNQPEGTKIWFKYPKDDRWRLISEPSWVVNGIYVINDELAEIRKAIFSGGVATPAVGVRISYSKLSGLDKLEVENKGIDLSISKGFAVLTPYAGIGRTFSKVTPVGVDDSLLKEEDVDEY